MTRTRLVETIPQWPGWILAAVGVLKLAQAGVYWLQTATWKPQTGVAALEELGFSHVRAWVAAPRSWIGLHKIAVLVLPLPAFVLYFAAGLLLVLAALPLVDVLEGRRRRPGYGSRPR
ncbi:MAG: hypothetical protein ACM3SX_01010 [Deltaproteobacteria bacterium]